MSASCPTTLNDLLWRVTDAEEQERLFLEEVSKIRDRAANAKQEAANYLRQIDGNEEAVEAYGRAWWLDDKGCVCSVKLRRAYDIKLEQEEPEPVADPVLEKVVATFEPRGDHENGHENGHARIVGYKPVPDDEPAHIDVVA